MIQDGGLPLSARSGELLTHVARMYASPRDVGKLSQELGLTSFSRTQVRHLSGGMRQRLAMAIALVGNPELVFLDEPSAGLDPAARREVWEFIAKVKGQGTTIILTSHLMDEVEYLADEVYILNSGEVIARGSVDELVSLEPPSDAPTALDHTASVRVRGAMTQADYAELQRWTQMRGLTVSQRSLEDAFLDLTGRTLQ